MTSSNKIIGQIGEDLACKYLEKNGYKIIERNKRYSRFCEIDIIAQEKNTIVFVEVKTRKNDNLGSPFEAITKTKYNHIKNGVFQYLNDLKNPKTGFRIDAIGIVLQPKQSITHLKNISI